MFNKDPPYKRKAFASLNNLRFRSKKLRQLRPSDNLQKQPATKIAIPRSIDIDTGEQPVPEKEDEGVHLAVRRVKLFKSAAKSPSTVSEHIWLNCQNHRLTIYSLQHTNDVYVSVPFPDIRFVDICSNPDSSYHFVVTLKSSITGTLRNESVRIDKLWVFLSLSDEEPYNKLVRNFEDQLVCNYLTASDMNNYYLKSESGRESKIGSNHQTQLPVTPPANFYGPAKTFSSDLEPGNIINTTRTRSLRLSLTDSIEDPFEYHAEIQDEDISRDEQIVFDPPLKYRFASKKSIIVSNKDFNSLYNGNWVNDSIVDFFLQYNLQQAREAGSLGSARVELFNSFFYTKLTMCSPDNDYYSNVRTWFKSNDSLFDNDYIVIPIMTDLHWFFVVITNLPRLRRYNETNEPEPMDGLLINKKKPLASIFVLDSLQKAHPNIAVPIKSFLVEYAKDKYHLDIPIGQIRKYSCNIPQQKNFNDCGLHVIYNCKKFFDSPEEFKAKILTEHRRKKSTTSLSTKLFDDEERKVIRMQLREVLLKLLKEQVEANGGDSSAIGTETYGTLRAKGIREPSAGAEEHSADELPDDEVMIVDEISNEMAPDTEQQSAWVESSQQRNISLSSEDPEAETKTQSPQSSPVTEIQDEEVDDSPSKQPKNENSVTSCTKSSDKLQDQKVSMILEDNGSVKEVIEFSEEKRRDRKGKRTGLDHQSGVTVAETSEEPVTIGKASDPDEDRAVFVSNPKTSIKFAGRTYHTQRARKGK
ncbi:hypothetical protein KL918_000621 [Ogataea parapolymorpha]|uniref:Ubiquitin-like protease family profile domain-containing protein n=1 Tax=Ogataea parapolymorpha (strain ATCC 26012 / BCRC 20466 / JCM 22074 / NRRL Y-7560 / DL-1) TaxID=871575 RepID=W1Q895_OGAPD|nr:hypothetical protein HPODL_01122 [Ogataea parapolymorpha DL-1]ESW97010.1 hypothetical protein HPODL_01122 [Ogataea parapolymorpha DL-1]KAG7869076.1 hypothetical protein KL918_000621 [Ogataea parapolymorpha]KAG7875874.1 hypothetical protein KL916_000545 [Ogataea parapolymorpha]